MGDTQMIIGIAIGIVLGALGLLVITRNHQKTVKKLIESRRKLERQRTKAVNDLFALRAEVENNPISLQQPAVTIKPKQDPKVAAEMANLRNLVARADSALAAARKKRDEYETEIARLTAALGQKDAKVIDLRPQDRPAGGIAL